MDILKLNDTTQDKIKADIFLSTLGNDTWSGRYQAPLKDGSDGPLKTLQEAKKRVRNLDKPSIKVLIRGGEYLINNTIVFSIQDSGNKSRTIVYEAYPEEKPIFNSGIKVGNWEKLTQYPDELPQKAYGKVWRAKIPKGLDTVLTMYDGDKRLERTYGPFFMPAKEIEYQRVDSLNVANKKDRHLLRRVDFPEGTLRGWKNIQDIELRFMPVPWTVNLLPLESVDEENHVAWLKVEATTPLSAKSRGIRVENAIDYLDSPGRWCVNTIEGEIYYWPEKKEPGDHIIIPSLKELIKVEGAIDYNGPMDKPVCNLHFKGLTFKYAKRDITDIGYKGWGIQHDWEMFDKDTAIFRFRGAENCSISNCHFYATSGTALRLDLHCQKIKIENNLFDDIGAMGILLCGYGPGTKDVNHNNIIKNNIITRCGEVIWHGHAVFLWQSGSNVVENNKIHHCARKGIGLCGVRINILKNRNHTFDEAAKTIRWNEIDKTIDMVKDEFDRSLTYLHTRDNIIRNNEIFRVLEKIGDGSALNISGAGTGNLIENNYLHHIATHDATSVIRTDDWQCGTTIRNNIIYKANICGIVRKNLNHIINNIIIDVNCKKGYIKFASYPNEKENFGSIIRNNIFYETGDDAVFYRSGYLVSEGATLPKHCKISNNIFYCAKNPEYAEKHLKEYQYIGVEQSSICCDPMFKDINKQDFSLLSESPAIKLGFKPINHTAIGITKDYPDSLRKLEYIKEDTAIYDRGRDERKEGYEWW